MSCNEFSVYQFFDDDSYEQVRDHVSVEEAMCAFIHYTTNVAVRVGIVKKVIITDGGDYTNMQWERGKGITYPPEAVGRQPRSDWPLNNEESTR